MANVDSISVLRSIHIWAVSLLLLIPVAVFAQNETFYYNQVKARGSESFTLSYDVANRNISNPAVYTFDSPKGPDWIIQLSNNLAYSGGNASKVILRLQEPAPSNKFVEVAMYGGAAHRFWVAFNGSDTNYQILYSQDSNGWTGDQPVMLNHASNQGLSVTDGKRTVVDRLDVNGFTLGSIMIYGNTQNSTRATNANGGSINVDVLYGSASESPIYYVPLGVMIGVGALIGGLLFFKKRKPDD